MDLNNLNGYNNAQVLSKIEDGHNVKKWASLYVSTFRCTYKLNLLVKFMQEIFRILVEEPNIMFIEAIVESFKIFIEPSVSEISKN